ncbi:MAG TPA: CheR family methyltransferase [Bacteroidales bacterium]|nr:CheR family methyltransferase [Bacteroidales bacterium]
MISRQLLQEVSSKVADLLGWDLYHHRLSDLKRGLTATAAELGIKATPAEIETWIRNTRWPQRELDILSSHLTVGETYFFREKASLNAFQQQIIPEIINRCNGHDPCLRIWSAGCCSGEEPYTLAILLNEAFPALQIRKIHLLGTDVNQSFLEKAKAGKYSRWSFRETPQLIQQKYFSEKEGVWTLDPRIRKMVVFSTLNLAEDLYPSAATATQNMDIIFCRNVLMYFTPDQIRLVVRRFYNSLTESGWLITSAVELNDQYFGDFETVKIGSCMLYRKNTVKPKKAGIAGEIKSPVQPYLVSPRKKKSSHVSVQSTHPVTGSVPPVEKPKPVSEKAGELFGEGKYDECIALCSAELSKSPGNPDLMLWVVRSMANLGKLDQAHEWAEKLRSSPDVKTDHLYLYAHILLEKNEFSEAVINLKRGLFLNPHHLMSHFLLVNIYSRMDNKTARMKHYRNVTDLLSSYEADEVVPDSGGLTAGRLETILKSLK